MMKMHCRPYWHVRILATLLATLVAAAGCDSSARPTGHAANNALPAATTATMVHPETIPASIPATGKILEVPLIRQADPRWKDVPLGTSGPGIGEEGCALACFAMVASYYGTPTTPPQANTQLGEYAYPLEWMAGESRFGLHVLRKDSIRFRDSKLHDAAYVRDTIEDSLLAGYPVIIGILQVSTGVPHFIVAYGLEPASGSSYAILVRDPSLNSDYELFEDIPAGWMITRLVVYRA